MYGDIIPQHQPDKRIIVSMRLAREETFGPVAPLFRFATDGDAIRVPRRCLKRGLRSDCHRCTVVGVMVISGVALTYRQIS